ncbi:hypothetical protein Tco_0116742 [Tanacetum coccineum]
MSIPYQEIGHVEVIDVFSCFGFLGPTHRNHGDRYDLRYRLSSIILYWGALILSFLAFCGSLGSVLNSRTSTKTSLASREKVIEATKGVSTKKFASIWPLTELRPLNSISCSPSSIAYLAIRPDFLGLARICFMGLSTALILSSKAVRYITKALPLIEAIASFRYGARPLFFCLTRSMCLNSFSMCSILKGFPPTIMVLRIIVMSAVHIVKNTLRNLLRGFFQLLLSFFYLIPILCMAVLPSSRLCGELDLTMTKLRTSVLAKGLSPIMISRGTSPSGQE